MATTTPDTGPVGATGPTGTTGPIGTTGPTSSYSTSNTLFVSGNHTIGAEELIIVNASTNINIDLPNLPAEYRSITIKNQSTSKVYLNRISGSAKIDGFDYVELGNQVKKDFVKLTYINGQWISLNYSGNASFSQYTETIFSEDFESYAEGSDLSGQGGWTGDSVYLNTNSYTGSRGADGFQKAGTALHWTHSPNKNIPIDRVTLFHFDMFIANNISDTSNNSGLWLNESRNDIAIFEVHPFWAQNGTAKGIQFRSKNSAPGISETVLSNVESNVKVTVVINPFTETVKAIFDINGVIKETSAQPLAKADLAFAKNFNIFQDYRYWSQVKGVIIDNIHIESLRPDLSYSDYLKLK
jgi:hypothetical protein